MRGPDNPIRAITQEPNKGNKKPELHRESEETKNFHFFKKVAGRDFFF